ncbi:SMI1/KNR4 family protein [Streptomyces coeruleoprunus]|uniref:SMI1/KNR4 family protein n=1 Tax=Streptomyces coeruleoprunus TaxID=285563 RepID=A0ABV9XKF1_9ACTN
MSGRENTGRAPTEADVQEAEQQLGITFPPAYRAHLLHPAPGLRRPRALRRGRDGWAWEGDDRTNHALLTTPFPHPASYRAEDEALDAREPREEDYPDAGSFQDAWREWDDACEEPEERKTAGAVYLQDDNPFYTLYVVTGPYRDTMWLDRRAISDDIVPITDRDGRILTFAEWYDWLPNPVDLAAFAPGIS